MIALMSGPAGPRRQRSLNDAHWSNNFHRNHNVLNVAVSVAHGPAGCARQSTPQALSGSSCRGSWPMWNPCGRSWLSRSGPSTPHSNVAMRERGSMLMRRRMRRMSTDTIILRFSKGVRLDASSDIGAPAVRNDTHVVLHGSRHECDTVVVRLWQHNEVRQPCQHPPFGVARGRGSSSRTRA